MRKTADKTAETAIRAALEEIAETVAERIAFAESEREQDVLFYVLELALMRKTKTCV